MSPINAYIFPEYVLPRLQPFVTSGNSKSSRLLRTTYASCLSSLVETASRYLNIMQALRADGAFPTNDPESEGGNIGQAAYQSLFDAAREDLMLQFESHSKILLTDPDTAVKRAFLSSVSSLCVFFGSAKANDVILSHLNTYLNDRDWMLKCAFFKTIVGVATYVGGASLEEYILPLMVQALADPEEFVVERVIRSFSSMAQLGLFQRSMTWELVQIILRFAMHPNIWVREAAVEFMSASTTYLKLADVYSMVVPLVRHELKFVPSEFSELQLLNSLKKPLPRLIMEMAAIWATKAEKGSFWKSVQNRRKFAPGQAVNVQPGTSEGYQNGQGSVNDGKSAEDSQWLERLRNAGMSNDDRSNLLLLKEYIWLVAHATRKNEEDSTPSRFNQIVSLTDLGITPQTVFFDHDQSMGAERQGETQNNSIAAALLEASTKRLDDASDPNRLSTPENISRRRSTDPKDTVIRRLADGSTAKNGAIDVPSRKVDPADNSDLPSSLGSAKEAKLRSKNVQHKGSALNLLARKEKGNKADAEIGTSSTNAFGEVEGLAAQEQALRQKKGRKSSAPTEKDVILQPAFMKYRGTHTYTGNDPNVLKMLDSIYLENFPGDLAEFGPQVASITKKQPIRYSSGQASPAPWRPEGTLVAILGEHTSAISRIQTAPNHAFFISASDDGSVKVWDSSRLERNVSYRSRMTHKHAAGSRVSSIAFVENTHCFISTATDGSIHVVKVDYIESNGLTRYGKPKVLRQHNLPVGEYAVWSDHYRAENQSRLMLATNKSRIIALDLRSMTELYEMQNPLGHGMPTCFCMDRKRHSLLLGTTHGILDLWDLRFRLRLRSWGFAGASPISRICLYPARRSRKYKVCISGGTGQGEVTVWDLERLSCLEIYRTAGVPESSKGHEVWDVEDERSSPLLNHFISVPEDGDTAVDQNIRAICVGAQVAEAGGDLRNTFFLSAGPDWQIRYWDMSNPEASKMVGGLQPDEARSTYEKRQIDADIILVSEIATSTAPGSKELVSANSSTSNGNRPGSNAAAGGRKGGRKDTRSRGMATQQQDLLRGHLDTVTDVALLEYPYGMVLSSDRSGVIYVFQ